MEYGSRREHPLYVPRLAYYAKERSRIKVLMFGWELPPYNSGGLGTACLGMTEGLAQQGEEVEFVLPDVFATFPYEHMRILSAAKFRSAKVIKKLLELSDWEEEAIRHSVAYQRQIEIDARHRLTLRVGEQLRYLSPSKQAAWYAYQAAAIAERENEDIIHCHDWMTYYCGIAAREMAARQGRKVPFVAHIHATEIDRCGENGDPEILEIERRGLQAADLVISVSHYTKELVHRRYGVPLNKIEVVHNGIPLNRPPAKYALHELKKHYKLVLFLGRLTYQKGPDYFLKLAKQVTDRDPKVKFLMVGSGDMEKRCIEEAARTGLTGKVLFSSFLTNRQEINRAYQMADLFIMPSVSEPFGLVALEALQNGTPVIVSKQSGVAEVAPQLPRLDFWDINAMADQVIYLLQQPEAGRQICQATAAELPNLSWDRAASKIKALYQKLLPPSAPQYA